MHLLLQPSYTESFNMVTADGVAEGVPSVVSHAIDWAPEHWKAMMDDVLDIARVGRYLLTDPYAPQEGIEALKVSQHRRPEILAVFFELLKSAFIVPSVAKQSSMQSPYE